MHVANTIQNQTWRTISKESVKPGPKVADESERVQDEYQTPSKVPVPLSADSANKENLVEERKPVPSQRNGLWFLLPSQ